MERARADRRNLRKGMKDLIKKILGKTPSEKLIFWNRVYAFEGRGWAREIQELGFKKQRNTFFHEIMHLQLEVKRVHLLI